MESDSDRIANSPEPSDEELAKLAQRGDIESGNRLFIRHGAELERLARSLLYWRLAEQSIKDVLQTAYRIAWENFASFGPPYRFVPWIYQILRNVSANKQKQVERDAKIFGPPSTSDEMNQVRADSIEYDRQDLVRLLKALDQELMRLDSAHQQIGKFMLDYFESNDVWPSKREMAQRTGIPASTALRCQQRVLQRWKPICRSRGFWPLT